MLFCVAIVVDSNENEVVCVLCNLGSVSLSLDLIYGTVGVLVVFQFDDEGGRIYILSGNEHKVGKSLA